MEGFGCILAGIWGTGSGTTSYSENVGAIGITKVSVCRCIKMKKHTKSIEFLLASF